MDRSAALEPTLENDLPYSKEAEQSVLGAIIADSSCLGEVLEYLKPESFYNSYNREIFSVLMRMYLASEKIDVVTLLDRVAGEGIFPHRERRQSLSGQPGGDGAHHRQCGGLCPHRPGEVLPALAGGRFPEDPQHRPGGHR